VKVSSKKELKALSVELKRLNTSLKLRGDGIYRKVLRSVVEQWTRVSGDGSLEQAVRSWNVPEMLRVSDGLVVQQYPTAAMHFAAHQMSALIRKYPWTQKESRLDPEGEAFKSFLLTEKRCKRINQWFLARRRRTVKVRPEERYFHRARDWIRYVLRDTPPLAAIYDKCDFTSGAGIGVHGDMTNLARKLLAESWTVGAAARPIFAAALSAHFQYARRTGAYRGEGRQCLQVTENDLDICCTTVNYNKVGFVPKTAKTHRVIAVEPLGNNYLQKGIDLAMRDRLRRVGLDLRWQSPNQQMAYKGSLDDSEDGFSTIDLSSASDSISTELCRELLPPDWFYFLNRVRSPAYVISELGVEEPRRYEKFVTMGNGFCFPLQTLLFASLVHAVDPTAKPGSDFRVFGDDIIVRQKIAREVIRLLAKVGFRTNVRKTFVSGPFRESCGSNWYKGEDVTPMTLDRKLDSLENLFKFINLGRRNELTRLFLEDAVTDVISEIPDKFLFYRPFKGRPETGIDPLGLEFTPRWTRNSALQCPEWLELHTKPVQDREIIPIKRVKGMVVVPDLHGWVVVAAVLRGNPSDSPFVLRRTVSTRVRRVARSSPETDESQVGPRLITGVDLLTNQPFVRVG